MPWFRVDDTLSSHPKARAAGLPAMGLWAVAGAYCAQYLTEGRVPSWYVAGWPSGKKLAARLVAADLWLITDDGWEFHQWEERQPTKEQVEADREATRIRQKEWRDRKRTAAVTATVTNAVSNAVSNAVTNGVTNTSPSLPSPTQIKETTSLIKMKSAPVAADAQFEQFWNVYPRSHGKRGAQSEFRNALKRADFDTVLAGAVRYRDDPNREDEFTAHGSTWLHQDRWLDGPLPSRSPVKAAPAKASGGGW